MNSLLLQMIAARASGSGNPALPDMLARVRAASGGSSIQIPNELLSQLGNGNPLVSALYKQLAEARTNGNACELTSPVIDVKPESDSCESQSEDRNRKQADTLETVDELKEQIQNLQAEIKVFRERSDLLASTVGACCLCWGQDPNCRACRGRGKPGYAIPDEALFGEFVLPAMRVLRAQKVKTNRAAESPRRQNGAESRTQIS